MAKDSRKNQDIYSSWHGQPKELLAKPKMTKTIEAIARKVTIESAGLLRKTEMKNDMLQAEICQLKLDMATTESSKAKVKEECARLKWELE